MSDEDNAVIDQPVEGEIVTPEVESAPTEETTPTEEVEAPEKAEITQPAEEKMVPLSALQRERELRKQADEQAAIFAKITEKGQDVPKGSNAEDTEFDPETNASLEKWYNKKKLADFQSEQTRKSAEFVTKHQDELKDPLLDAMVVKVIRDANSIGKVIDQEEALTIAKSTLESRLQTAETKAKTTGFDEGQQTALRKTQGSAIGDAVKKPEVDVSKMSASEYASYFGIERVEV